MHRNQERIIKLLRSRGTSERILILFAAARNRDILDCNLAAPIIFFQGLRYSFMFTEHKNEARSSFVLWFCLAF